MNLEQEFEKQMTVRDLVSDLLIEIEDLPLKSQRESIEYAINQLKSKK